MIEKQLYKASYFSAYDPRTVARGLRSEIRDPRAEL